MAHLFGVVELEFPHEVHLKEINRVLNVVSLNVMNVIAKSNSNTEEYSSEAVVYNNEIY